MEKLIGQLCIAANKADIELTVRQLYSLARALGDEFALDEKKHQENCIKEFMRKSAKVEIVPLKQSQPMNDPDPAPTEIPTDSKIESVDTPAETPVKEKASGDVLPPRQKQLWDYVQAHPDASRDVICADIGITTVNYHFLKRKLKDKGYIINPPAGTNKNTKKYGRNTLANIGKIHQDEKRDMDKRMEDAYLGEHPNIQPDPVQKKPVSEKAQRLYEYMKSHPDSRMPKTCEDLGICNGDYYMLKAQLKKNGWIDSAVENVQAY